MTSGKWNELDTVATMLGHRVQLRYFIRGIAIVWTLIVLSLLCTQLLRQNDQIVEVASLQARSLIQRDLVYRRWVALNGGIYVPVSQHTPPNPLLSSLRDRDLVAPDGKKLTLVNPAYMSRLVYELAAKEDGTRSHITSLKPLRAENAADPWESEALQAFAEGRKEYRTVVHQEGAEYFRLMTPLFTNSECLECHALQGYRTGDVRGGISVTMPLAALRSIAVKQKVQSVIGFSSLWLFGMAGILTSSASLRRTLRNHEEAEKKLRYMSTHDSLTDSYNRIYFETELDRFAKGRTFPVGVIMVDLDRLKQVNDRLGHSAGDDLIRRAAEILKRACREYDVIARIGGDEFALLLPGVDRNTMPEVLARIRKCEAEANQEPGAPEVGLSLGGVCAESQGTLRDALKEADLQMYRNKIARKRKSVVCTPSNPAS